MNEFPLLLFLCTMTFWIYSIQREGGIGIGIRFLYVNTVLQQFLVGPFLYTYSGLAEVDASYADRGGAVELACYSMIAFLVGGYWGTPWLLRRRLDVDVAIRPFADPVRLAEQYRVGRLLLFVGVLALPFYKLFESVQTLRAITSQMIYLIDVGAVMMMLSVLIARERAKLAMPFFYFAIGATVRTIMTGFFGLNMRTSILLLALMFMFRRCSLRSWFYFALVCYLAIIPYQVWMMARRSLRESIVWRRPLTERVEVFTRDVSMPALASPFDHQLAEDIQSRIDYSHLLAAALRHTPTKEPYAWGSTIIIPSLTAPIPRIIWPSKPVVAGGSAYVTRFTGIEFQGVSVATNLLFEFYVNYGPLGTLVGSLILGMIFGVVEYTFFARAPRSMAFEWTALLCMFTLAGGFDRVYLLSMTIPVDLFIGWILIYLFRLTGLAMVDMPRSRRRARLAENQWELSGPPAR